LSLDFLAIIGLVVYSYLVWRRDPNRISPAGVPAAPGAIEQDQPEERS
jgi:hypothetical protein